MMLLSSLNTLAMEASKSVRVEKLPYARRNWSFRPLCAPSTLSEKSVNAAVRPCFSVTNLCAAIRLTCLTYETKSVLSFAGLFSSFVSFLIFFSFSSVCGSSDSGSVSESSADGCDYSEERLRQTYSIKPRIKRLKLTVTCIMSAITANFVLYLIVFNFFLISF